MIRKVRLISLVRFLMKNLLINLLSNIDRLMAQNRLKLILGMSVKSYLRKKNRVLMLTGYGQQMNRIRVRTKTINFEFYLFSQ